MTEQTSDYDMSIHTNPDAMAWTKFFREKNPDCNVDDDAMLGWFANSMMAMHDFLLNAGPINGDHAQELLLIEQHESIEINEVSKITAKEFAAMLNGREHTEEITPDEMKLAKDNNLVVVFGASDDLMEVEGAIYGELYAYEGTTTRLTKEGILEAPCDDERDFCIHKCKYFKETWNSARTIEAIWGDGNVSWQYKTDIPHETFNIIEDDEVYCRGIVFSMDDV